MRGLTVATVMTKDPVTVAPDTEFKDIVEILARHSISAVPVVGRDGVPIGVVSETDLIHKQEQPSQPKVLVGQQTRERWHRATAERALELMTVPVRAVSADKSVSFAARELNRRGVRRLFVIDQDRLVGVVSRRDLLRVFLRSDEDIQVDVEREVFQRVLWLDLSAITVSVNRGVVTLTGRLDRRSEVEIAGRLTPTIPGVVEVRNRLDHAWNDQVHN
ncbi:CBS domain-containing protein [Kibdelosporangium banguiense]|uniref:CBS domain-containing protein n=1 Tax=Kibdelosporangium banguiense TaxID=1365924 RepID=A0ABS4TXV2_9PSEU|nr:CBS domain-containing protein [Kibdelosporangium banguiense]MBP2328766.1 CBS domain-containing protein [Kibdelosporangium banguiense]